MLKGIKTRVSGRVPRDRGFHGLQSTGSQRVRRDWATDSFYFERARSPSVKATAMYPKRQLSLFHINSPHGFLLWPQITCPQWFSCYIIKCSPDSFSQYLSGQVDCFHSNERCSKNPLDVSTTSTLQTGKNQNRSSNISTYFCFADRFISTIFSRFHI